MEEIVQKLDELISVINNNAEQSWLNWVGILVPIGISLIAIILDIVLNIKNKKLQKQLMEKEEFFQKKLSDRDVKAQMHSDFLKIYDDFCYLQNVIGNAKDRVEEYYIDTNLLNQWISDLYQSARQACQARNRAHLLIPDDDVNLPDVLDKLWEKIILLREKINIYAYSDESLEQYNMAWYKVNRKYPAIEGDINKLRKNIDAYRCFVESYRNLYTIEINQIICEILVLYKNDKFDKYFEPYIKLER